jgi:sulfide:quinone oxidoreductase
MPSAAFKPELVCIVDTLDSGILVYRSERFNFVLPRLKLCHWLKRAFETHYLKAYRTPSGPARMMAQKKAA